MTSGHMIDTDGPLGVFTYHLPLQLSTRDYQDRTFSVWPLKNSLDVFICIVRVLFA